MLKVSQTRNVAYVDSILRFIIKLCQNAVTFSVFDDLFLMWLETILAMDLCREVRIILFIIFRSS